MRCSPSVPAVNRLIFHRILQNITTLVVGMAIGIAFVWKLGLVALACSPLIISMGYIRLVRLSPTSFSRSISLTSVQRVVIMKDQANKAEHDASAQVACEAAGAIRTVASLTRERDCCAIYSASLDGPRRRSNRAALSSSLLFAVSQSMTFYVIALVFWLGAVWVSKQEITQFHFFVTLMVCLSLLLDI